jgi:hypothetical protein
MEITLNMPTIINSLRQSAVLQHSRKITEKIFAVRDVHRAP